MTVQHDVVVVVPTYNERETISDLTRRIRANGYRVLVVDDASPDGTGELVEQLGAEDPNVEVLHRPAKRGLGAAYGDGFARALAAGPEIVCQMDADFSHDPGDLPRLVAAIEDGADVAVGSRYVSGGSNPDWPLARRLISRGGNIYARWLLGLPVRDATGGFRAFRAGVLRELDPATAEASGYAFQVEIIRRATEGRLVITEVPIIFRDRRHGRSKMTGRVVAEAMWLVTRWGWRRIRAKLGWRAG